MTFLGKYTFEIREVIADGFKGPPLCFLITGTDPNGGTIITHGFTKEEAMDNMCDAFLTAADVKVSWWNRLIHRLRIY